MSFDFRVGAVDWRHAAWQGSFYPEDLPGEWRLTYYANEFPLVLVPVECWQAADERQCLDWREDVGEQFEFVLDVTVVRLGELAVRERLAACVSGLDSRLAGVVCWSTMGEADRRWLQDLLGNRRFLALGGESVDGCRLAVAGPGCCALIGSETAGDLRGLRTLMETLLSGRCGAGPVRLFIAGDPPAIKQLQEASLLLQLLQGDRAR